MLKLIKTLHNNNIIHRDIKPSNIAYGLDNKNEIYLFDLGLAMRYTKDNHIKSRSVIGTVRYSSLNAHKRIKQSKRDDLESLCYVLIFLLNGKLPWQNVTGKNKKDRYHIIYNLKKRIYSSSEYKNIPTVYINFLEYIRSLKYDDKPDYTHYINMFQSELDKLTHKNRKKKEIQNIKEIKQKGEQEEINIKRVNPYILAILRLYIFLIIF